MLYPFCRVDQPSAHICRLRHREPRQNTGSFPVLGETHALVAVEVEHDRHHGACSSGIRWLRAAGRAGRRPKLDARQRRKIERALVQGALAHGFDTDLWTCERVVIVIQRLPCARATVIS
jgi:hypothetical protein